jgi:hypothetical protein
MSCQNVSRGKGEESRPGIGSASVQGDWHPERGPERSEHSL